MASWLRRLVAWLLAVLARLTAYDPGMAAPTVATFNQANTSSNNTTAQYTVPALQSGDVVVLIVGSDGDNTLQSISAIGGDAWSIKFTAGTARTAVSAHIATLRATAARAATQVTLTFTDTEIYGFHCYVCRGAHATSDPEVAVADANPGNDLDPPALTPSWGAEENLWIAGGVQNDDPTASIDGVPANYTNPQLLNMQTGSGVTMGSGRRVLNAATEDPGVMARTGNEVKWAFTIAVRGSAGGPVALDGASNSASQLTGNIGGIATTIALDGECNSASAFAPAELTGIAPPTDIEGFALTASHSDATQQVYTTASVTPTGGSVMWLAVALRQLDATGQPTTPTITGLGATWTLQRRLDYDTSSTRGALFVFSAVGHSGSGAVSIDCLSNHVGAVWSLTETTGADTTDPLVQVADIAADQAGNTVTLTSAPLADSATMSACAAYEGTLTEEAGHTKLNQGGPATGNSNLTVATDFKYNPADQTHAWTFAVATHGIIGWEVRKAGAPPVTLDGQLASASAFGAAELTGIGSAGTLDWSIVGVPRHDSVMVNAKLTGASSAVLKAATDAALTTGVVTSGAETPDGNGFVSFTLAGLTADTDYHYGVEVDSQASDAGLRGTFHTMPTPGTPFSFTFTHASCVNNPASTNAQNVMREIMDIQGPLFHAWCGDFDYGDDTVEANMRASYDAQIANATFAEFLRTVPWEYSYSDHDFLGNNVGGDENATTRSQRLTRSRVARDYFPMRDLGDTVTTDGPLYRSWEVGRVLFVMPDERWHKSANSDTDGPSKVMWGSAQRTWLQTLLAGTSARLVVMFHDTPWQAPVVANDDDWGAYSTERTAIADIIDAAGIPTIHLHGDMHGVAAADKSVSSGLDFTTAQNGTVPTIVGCGAAWDQTGSTKGGPYRITRLGATSQVSEGAARYGRCAITDDGSTITVSWTGRQATSQTTSVVQVPTDGAPLVLGLPALDGQLSSASYMDGGLTARIALGGQLSSATQLDGTLAVGRALTGALSSASELDPATLTRLRALDGQLESASSLADAAVGLILGLNGQAASGSALDATAMARTRGLAADILSASALAAAELIRTRGLTGQTNSATRLRGILTSGAGFDGTLESASRLIGQLGVRFPIAGSLSSASAVGDAALARTRALAGEASSATLLSASLSARVGLTGDLASATSLEGTAGRRRALSASLGSASYLDGLLVIGGSLFGDLSSASQLDGVLGLRRALDGQLASASELDATLARRRALTGDTGTASQLEGQLVIGFSLAGVLASASLLAGELDADPSLAGQLASASHLAGALALGLGLTGDVASATALVAVLARHRPLSGTLAAASQLAAALTVVGIADGRPIGRGSVRIPGPTTVTTRAPTTVRT